MDKIGLFARGKLLNVYPNEPEYQDEAIDDCKFATEESGVFHELKIINSEDIKAGKFK
ncbi:hypothetical protein [Paenibacillus lautus]|uniref:hypothetical protein n=1 Tax=Paenibacillus lautus TaxID=1401 RepID=UPI001C7D94BD|nr:hypothetical protein [Paenibacillus lautus]MBX4152420.1 hypothetical protein [Paenibacillus lautus]